MSKEMAENTNDQQMVNDDDDKDDGTSYITWFNSHHTFPYGATNVLMMIYDDDCDDYDDANITGET